MSYLNSAKKTPTWARRVIAILILTPGVSIAACEPWIDDAANSRELTVGSVQINNRDVFDENIANENLGIHQLANQLHIKSKRELIDAQLLFSQGDAFDQEALAETARNLRANRYLRSATVTPMQICDGQVDILVETGDNWSLIPSFNFARAGGENAFAFRLAELNLLGLGKSLELELDYTPERDQRVMRYHDPMLFGSKTQFTTQIQDNTDGEVQVLDFSRPFGSLDARTSWRVRAGNTEYAQNIYRDGLIQDQLAVDQEFAALEYGFSDGKQRVRTTPAGKNINRVIRWRTGWQYNRTRLGATAAFPDSTPIAERLFSYPFLQMTLIQPEFIEQTNLQLMGSVEDIAIGHKLRARIGWAAKKLGSTKDAGVLETEYSKGWQPGAQLLGLLKTSASGFVDNDGIENGIASATLQGFYFKSRKNRFFASANFIVGNQLFEDKQIVLGGETGLRGYPRRFQSGSRRARATVEQRYFLDWYPLRLARVGTAVFADIGSAWDKGEDPELLRDVGFGLRIVGTRQADAKVMHIDFAFPLDAKDRIESFQFVVSAKTQF